VWSSEPEMRSSGVVEMSVSWRAKASFCAVKMDSVLSNHERRELIITFCIRGGLFGGVVVWPGPKHEIRVQRKRRHPMCMIFQSVQ
jgi:hypothetical protein